MIREFSEDEERSLSSRAKRDAPAKDDGWGAAASVSSEEAPLEARRVADEAEVPHQDSADDQTPSDGWGAGDAATSEFDGEEKARDANSDGADDPRQHRTIADAVARSEAQQVETLGEAADYAEQRLGIEHADFTGFDQPTANEVNAALEALQDRYPGVHSIRFLGTIQQRNAAMERDIPGVLKRRPDLAGGDAETVAQTLGGTSPYAGIAISEEWANFHALTTSRLRQQSKEGGHPPHVDSITGVVAHEFGHVVANDLRRRGTNDETVGPLVEGYFSRGDAWIEKNVSGYATSNPNELLGEAFAEYHLSPTPREPARRIGRAIDEAYNKE